MSEQYGWYDYKNLAFDVGFAGTIEQKSVHVHRSCGTRVRYVDETWFCDECRIPIWNESELKHPKVQSKQVYTIGLKSSLESGQAWLDIQELSVDAEHEVALS